MLAVPSGDFLQERRKLYKVGNLNNPQLLGYRQWYIPYVPTQSLTVYAPTISLVVLPIVGNSYNATLFVKHRLI